MLWLGLDRYIHTRQVKFIDTWSIVQFPEHQYKNYFDYAEYVIWMHKTWKYDHKKTKRNKMCAYSWEILPIQGNKYQSPFRMYFRCTLHVRCCSELYYAKSPPSLY